MTVSPLPGPAGGSSCGAGVTGADASVAVNYLLTIFLDPAPRDAVTGAADRRTLEDQEARKNLVVTLAPELSLAVRVDIAAAQIEIVRTDLFVNGQLVQNWKLGDKSWISFDEWLGTSSGQQALAIYGSASLVEVCLAAPGAPAGGATQFRPFPARAESERNTNINGRPVWESGKDAVNGHLWVHPASKLPVNSRPVAAR